MPLKIVFVFGTRPEAIKLAPILRCMGNRPHAFRPVVCVTSQHRELLDQVLRAFDVVPQYDLKLMLPGQTLSQSASRILAGLEPVLSAERPDLVLVQGDTTTTLCGALAAFYAKVPVGHVEAGLRTGDPAQPFPEEMNRVLTTRLSSLHFAATGWAAANLAREGVPQRNTVVTGNPGIDAVHYVRDALAAGTLSAPDWPWMDPSKRLLLVTAHRRESFGEGLEHICTALEQLAQRGDVQIVYPVHPNPSVQRPVTRVLGGVPNITLTGPLGYVPFVDLMNRAHLLLTDSGGIQEEGPSLGKPVLVMREKTERPEAVEAGTARLVGTGVSSIVSGVEVLLDDAPAYHRASRVHNPFGDGHASERIADAILSFLS